MTAKHISKKEFFTKVADYMNTDGEWQFLGDKPALIDFYASWCGPCKMLSPVLDEIAGEYNGRVDVYTVDVDRDADLAAAFGIRSIPTMLFVPMNGMPTRAGGVMPKQEIGRMLDQML